MARTGVDARGNYDHKPEEKASIFFKNSLKKT
jgi:hypothetical protein